ncbi:proteobacterial lipase chaperone family protein, partial [Vibrio parahaemolyticus V-223/04]
RANKLPRKTCGYS